MPIFIILKKYPFSHCIGIMRVESEYVRRPSCLTTVIQALLYIPQFPSKWIRSANNQPQIQFQFHLYEYETRNSLAGCPCIEMMRTREGKKSQVRNIQVDFMSCRKVMKILQNLIHHASNIWFWYELKIM